MFCGSANIIRNLHLKTCSYPFDWCFSTLDIVTKCIGDNFEKLLDSSHYIDSTPFTTYETACGHVIYHKAMFPHRDMRIAENHSYLKRCVERFQNSIRSDKLKLFILTIHPNEIYPGCPSHDDMGSFIDTLPCDKRTVFVLVIRYVKDSVFRIDTVNVGLYRLVTIHHTSNMNGVCLESCNEDTALLNHIRTLYSFEKAGSECPKIT